MKAASGDDFATFARTHTSRLFAMARLLMPGDEPGAILQTRTALAHTLRQWPDAIDSPYVFARKVLVRGALRAAGRAQRASDEEEGAQVGGEVGGEAGGEAGGEVGGEAGAQAGGDGGGEVGNRNGSGEAGDLTPTGDDDVLWLALGGLAPADRAALVLRCFDSCDDAEIAGTPAASTSAAAARSVQQALDSLRAAPLLTARPGGLPGDMADWLASVMRAAALVVPPALTLTEIREQARRDRRRSVGRVATALLTAAAIAAVSWVATSRPGPPADVALTAGSDISTPNTGPLVGLADSDIFANEAAATVDFVQCLVPYDCQSHLRFGIGTPTPQEGTAVTVTPPGGGLTLSLTRHGHWLELPYREGVWKFVIAGVGGAETRLSLDVPAIAEFPVIRTFDVAGLETACTGAGEPARVLVHASAAGALATTGPMLTAIQRTTYADGVEESRGVILSPDGSGSLPWLCHLQSVRAVAAQTIDLEAATTSRLGRNLTTVVERSTVHYVS